MRVLLKAPFPAQHRVDAQRRPLALEPVSLDQARFAAEAEALEQTANRDIPIIGLSKDSMYLAPVEQFAQDDVRASVARPFPWLARASVIPISAVAG